MEVTEFLREVKINNNYQINRLDIHCNASYDRQKVELVCRNDYGRCFLVGTAILFMSQLPLEWKQAIIVNNNNILVVDGN